MKIKYFFGFLIVSLTLNLSCVAKADFKTPETDKELFLKMSEMLGITERVEKSCELIKNKPTDDLEPMNLNKVMRIVLDVNAEIVEMGKYIRKSEEMHRVWDEIGEIESSKWRDIPIHAIDYNYETRDTTELEQYIKDYIDNDFDASYYEKEFDDKEVAETGSGRIKYTFYIYGNKTDITYDAIIENYAIKRVWKTGDAVYPENVPESIYEAIPEEKIKKQALANSGFKQGLEIEVKGQYVFLKENPDTKKLYAIVMTVLTNYNLDIATQIYTYSFTKEELNKIYKSSK